MEANITEISGITCSVERALCERGRRDLDSNLISYKPQFRKKLIEELKFIRSYKIE